MIQTYFYRFYQKKFERATLQYGFQTFFYIFHQNKFESRIINRHFQTFLSVFVQISLKAIKNIEQLIFINKKLT
jgi:hypothetical protein